MEQGGPDLEKFAEWHPQEKTTPPAEGLVSLATSAHEQDQHFSNLVAAELRRIRSAQERSPSSPGYKLAEGALNEVSNAKLSLASLSADQGGLETLPSSIDHRLEQGQNDEAKRAFQEGAAFLWGKRVSIGQRRRAIVSQLMFLQDRLARLPGQEEVADLQTAVQQAARSLGEADLVAARFDQGLQGKLVAEEGRF